jgi:alkylation response protein AidB-like acyl-CoA dehydrogenase
VDLDLSREQQELVAVYHAFFVKESPPSVVRSAEPLGFDPSLWSRVARLGGPAIGVSEGLGGGGARLLDLVLIAEELGCSLAPIPLLEGMVAARLLARSGDIGRKAVERLTLPNPAVATVALMPTRDGRARMVPAGAIADLVVGLDGCDLVLVSSEPPIGRRNLGDFPVADRSFQTGRTLLASGSDALDLYADALDEWRILTAGALAGLGATALGLGVDYAKQRKQFGVPIGSFQSIARDLADVATAVDGAKLLAREAAWAADCCHTNSPALAGMAFLFAGRTAQKASSVALHVHGGYGFTLEYDIQLYYRRAKAWSLTLGDPRRGLRALAETLFGADVGI